MDDGTVGCGCVTAIALVVLGVVWAAVGSYSWIFISAAVLLIVCLVIAWRTPDTQSATTGTTSQRADDPELAKLEELERQEYLTEQRIERHEAAELERLLAVEENARDQALSSVFRRSSLMEEIAKMSGTEFEEFVADFLQAQGYVVQTTTASGDQGVDLLVKMPDSESTIAVQIKRYSRPLGNKPVQEAFAGMVHYKAVEAWVLTNSSFTPGAHGLALSTAVKLIGGDELTAWFDEVSTALNPEPISEGDQQLASEIAEERGEEHPGESVGAHATPSIAEQIRELGKLRDEGLITGEEFEGKKRDLLRRM